MSVIVGRPWLRDRRPCPWGVVFGLRRIHVLADILWGRWKLKLTVWTRRFWGVDNGEAGKGLVDRFKT